MPIRVLIVEDDEAIALGLAMNLRIDGYEVTVVHDGESALARIGAERPALVVLDITLPKKSGLDVLRELRARPVLAGGDVPVIVLSARQSEYDKVAALRLGADDYVTKPFALAELMARCSAVLRRYGGGRREADEARALSFGDVSVDRDMRRVTRAGVEITLTPLEFELLRYFVEHPGQIVSREQLLRDVWGAQAGAGSPRTVDNFVAQLRTKLEPHPDHPRHFVTVRGAGYRFELD